MGNECVSKDNIASKVRTFHVGWPMYWKSTPGGEKVLDDQCTGQQQMVDLQNPVKDQEEHGPLVLLK